MSRHNTDPSKQPPAPPAQPPQGQAGDGAQPVAPPAPAQPGPGVADMGDAASGQASQPATAAPAPPSAHVAAAATDEPRRQLAALFKTNRKITVASVAMRMRNRSEQIGFFRGQRIKPGMTFTLPAGAPIGRWMEPVEGKQADQLAAALEASPKTRGSAGVVLKERSRSRSGAGDLRPLETGATRDEGI